MGGECCHVHAQSCLHNRHEGFRDSVLELTRSLTLLCVRGISRTGQSQGEGGRTLNAQAQA